MLQGNTVWEANLNPSHVYFPAGAGAIEIILNQMIYRVLIGRLSAI